MDKDFIFYSEEWTEEHQRVFNELCVEDVVDAIQLLIKNQTNKKEYLRRLCIYLDYMKKEIDNAREMAIELLKIMGEKPGKYGWFENPKFYPLVNALYSWKQNEDSTWTRHTK